MGLQTFWSQGRALAGLGAMNEQNRYVTITLTTAQLAVFTFVGLVALGVVTGSAYLLGRRAATEVRAERAAAGDQILLVDPPAAARSSPPAAPSPPSTGVARPNSGEASARIDRPVATDPAAGAGPSHVSSPSQPGSSPVALRDPVPGLYLQVVAAPARIAEAYARRLRELGFPAVLAPGPDSHNVRVLVGPVPEGESWEQLQSQLRESGFDCFPRRYVAGSTQ